MSKELLNRDIKKLSRRNGHVLTNRTMSFLHVRYVLSCEIAKLLTERVLRETVQLAVKLQVFAGTNRFS